MTLTYVQLTKKEEDRIHHSKDIEPLEVSQPPLLCGPLVRKMQ